MQWTLLKEPLAGNGLITFVFTQLPRSVADSATEPLTGIDSGTSAFTRLPLYVRFVRLPLPAIIAVALAFMEESTHSDS